MIIQGQDSAVNSIAMHPSAPKFALVSQSGSVQVLTGAAGCANGPLLHSSILYSTYKELYDYSIVASINNSINNSILYSL